MAIFRTNDPTQFDDIDGIIIDERTPPSSITGVAANVGVLVGQFQRGPKELSLPISSITELQEVYGRSDYLGNIQLRNKAFGALRIIRVVAADAVRAELEVDAKLKFVAKSEGAYGNNICVTVENSTNDVVTPAVSATFAGPISGITVPVGLQAVTAGIVGNSILLTGDGTATLAALVAAWNTANPTNQVLLTAGDGAEVPDAAEAMQLAGGVDEVVVTEGGFKVTVQDKNPGTPLPIEVYDNILIADITPATFVRSLLVDVEVLDAASGEVANTPEAPLALGSDGTILDTDYEAALVRAEEAGAGNVLFLDEYNPVRNLMLRTHASLTQDKMVICAGGVDDDRAAVITEAGNLRDADGRVIYAWPYVETLINGVRTYTSPASWMASLFTQVAPNVALSFTANTRFLGGVSGLRFTTGRQGHVALDQAGVAAFERDPDIGFVLKNAVVTQIQNTFRNQILDRRMVDFLSDSIGRALKNWQNDVNSFDKRAEIAGAILAFDTGLVNAGVLPGEQDVTEGRPVMVDAETGNTDASIAEGRCVIIYKRRIFSSKRYIILQTEIGRGVVVTDV